MTSTVIMANRQEKESNPKTLIKMIEFNEGYHTYYIYIITNKTKIVLYTGVTNNPPLPRESLRMEC